MRVCGAFELKVHWDLRGRDLLRRRVLYGIESRLLWWVHRMMDREAMLLSVAEEYHWVMMLHLRNHGWAILVGPWCCRARRACLKGDMGASMRSGTEVEARRLEDHSLVIAFATSFAFHAIPANWSLFAALDAAPPASQAAGLRTFSGQFGPQGSLRRGSVRVRREIVVCLPCTPGGRHAGQEIREYWLRFHSRLHILMASFEPSGTKSSPRRGPESPRTMLRYPACDSRYLLCFRQ